MSNNECIEWIKSWINNPVAEQIHNSCFKKKTKVYKLYRGLSWDIEDEINQLHDNLQFDKYKKGSIITVPIKKISSWSTDEETAERFANEGFFGVVLELNVNSKYILVDFKSTLLDDIKMYEDEVILYPGNYQCKIKSLHNNLGEGNISDLSFGMYRYADIDVRKYNRHKVE